jgi:uncharacterized protein YjbJ (UPF0337 family)
MSHEEEKGASKQVKGKIKEAAGVLTDNKEGQAKGKIEKTEGKTQEKTGHIKRKLKDEYEEES